MMQRMTRYVVAELLKVFLIALAGTTLLLILLGLAHQAIREGLGPVAIARLVPYVLPNALRFAIPGTILFATCSLYGRMSASNEIVAIKSCGITPWVIVLPALTLAFILSLLSVWLNDVAVSWGRSGIQRVVLQSAEQIIYGILRTQKSYSTDQLAINVLGVDGRKLIMPTIAFRGKDDSPDVTLTAHSAEIRYNPENESLTLRIQDSEFDVGDTRGTWPNEFQHEISLAAAAQKGERGDSPSQLAMRMIPSRRIEQVSVIEQEEQRLAVEASFQLLTGDLETLKSDHWQRRRDGLQNSRLLLSRLQTEPWRRWAYGFSCLMFVFVGVGLAIRLRNADFWTSFGLCFLPILLVYYPLLEYGVDRAKCGALPPYSVWIANFVFLGLATWFMRKVVRY